MRLYEIDNALLELMENGYNDECVDAETGEFLEDRFEELMARYTAERDVKIENIALYIKDTVAECDALKAEEKRLADRRKAKENKVKWLKDYLTTSMLQAGDSKFESAKCVVSFRKSVSVNADMELIPAEYVTEKVERTANKTAIKKALQDGETIIGAYLEEKQNIQIK